MRVTLNQQEIFGALADYLRDKLNLDNTASIDISFTAGRPPKGYTADVDITYPPSELASRFTARDADETGQELTGGEVGDTTPADLGSNPHAEALSVEVEAAPTDAGTASAGNLFG